MEQVLHIAKKTCDSAEIYSLEDSKTKIEFRNNQVHNIECTMQTGVCLRVIKNGKLGFAYTRNLTNRNELVKNAIDALAGGVDALYDFPLTTKIQQLNTYDQSIEKASSNEVVDECARVYDILKYRTDAETRVNATIRKQSIRILNNNGTDISTRNADYQIWAGAILEGSETGIWRVFENKRFDKMPDAIIGEIAEFYRMYSSDVKPEGGKMKVLFMPSSMVFLLWRILYGTSSRVVYEKRSPLADKMEAKIFSEKITIYDDPLEDSYPEARAFDDEGVQCKPLTIVANGELKSFYYDLNYAHKMGVVPTGHGYKYDYFGKDSLTRKPTPYLGHLRIKYGNKTFSQLLRTIKRGIILEGILGPHAGNLFNGDYSIGLNPGLYVENGQIVGRIKDAMIAGNTYETLSNVIDIGDSLCPCYWYYCVGRVPAILCDNISVTVRK